MTLHTRTAATEPSVPVFPVVHTPYYCYEDL